mgnify:CR=1 FL=1
MTQPKESRWLDPASVPVGPEMETCCPPNGDGSQSACVYPTPVGGWCPSCSDRLDRDDDTGTTVLPPSVLTPAPWWEDRPPRVPYLLITGTAYDRYWPPVDMHMPRSPCRPRVYKVRAERTDMETGHGSTYLARWKAF